MLLPPWLAPFEMKFGGCLGLAIDNGTSSLTMYSAVLFVYVSSCFYDDILFVGRVFAQPCQLASMCSLLLLLLLFLQMIKKNYDDIVSLT